MKTALDLLHDADMADLLARAQFRRFLFRIVDLGDLLRSTYGTDDRHLAMREGRRSLGLEILDMAAAVQPDALIAVLIEETKNPKEAPSGRRNSRYDTPDD